MQNLRSPFVPRNTSARRLTPALDLWRRELEAGHRTRFTFDPLWRAACAELNALESVAIPQMVAFYRAEARRILRAATRAAA